MSGVIVLLLAAVFLIAAVSKLRAQDAFRAVLRNLLPERLVDSVALMVPWVELLFVGLLLSGIAPQKTIIAATALLAVFTIVLGEMWRRGLKGCACFGESVNTATTGSGIVRNIMLMTAAGFVLIRSEPISFFGPDFSTFLGRITVVAGALCFWSGVVAVVNRRKMIFNF